MQDLGSLTNADWAPSSAFGVSADGSVIVGQSSWGGLHPAFRWTQAGGMENLGTLGGYHASALGVSSDGSVVIGWSYTPSNMGGQPHAFRWTQATGMQDLGTLGGTWSEAWGISADGSIIVGWARNASSQDRAVRWTQNGGIEDLNQTYAGLLANGSVLRYAYDISPDGRYIVGWGYNVAMGREEAYLLDTGPRCPSLNGDVDDNGCVDDADLLTVLFAFGNSGSNLGRMDVNCDGTVDDADLLIVLFNFGDGC